MKLALFIFSLFVVLACGQETPMEIKDTKEEEMIENTRKDIRFIALGDSYTIGESVLVEERWPVQLAARLEGDDVHTSELKIIATTGWRTNQLIDAIEQEKPSEDWDLVSLLIGVNNQYREYPIEQYTTEFTALLDTGIRLTAGNKERVFVVSIPDYAYTPFGQTRDGDKISRELDQYNRIAAEICNNKDIPFINITDISRRGLDEPNLVAGDRLHPSGDMYTLWVNEMYDTVLKMIKN